MTESKPPPDSDLSTAFARNAPSHSVLTRIQENFGHAPRVSLRDESDGSAGAPIVDPKSQEKLSLPQGRGAYNFLGEIARGGMGVVVKAQDTDLGRDVAVKVLNKDLCKAPEIVQRFVEEAQIGGQLQHPGIVPVYELGLMADDRPYFSMKLVKGRTLATLLSERRSAQDERRRLLDIFESVCQTMGYAHSRGVIHRDIKPANIMVGAFGEVQVVDWGLAKVLARGGKADEKRAKDARTIHTVLETVRSKDTKSGSGSDSMVGSVMGTPAYMPPEQAAGHVDRLDERSDVFSLGATLCEILTGRPPYQGENEHTLVEAAQGKTGPALERLDACGAEPELIELAKQCLMPAAAARPRNAGVLAERMHEHIVSLEERAQAARVEAAEARVHAAEERRARRLTAALAAAVLGIGVVGGGGWVWVQNERAVRERDAAARELESAERERELVARVNSSLNEASALQGQSLFAEALAAVERAEALAETGAARPELRASIDEVRGSVTEAADAAREKEDRARKAAVLLAELDEIGRGGASPDAASPSAWSTFDGQYAEAFRARGIDVDAAQPEEAIASLERLGLGPELAPALDRWLVARRNIARARAGNGREDLVACARLVDITNAIDRDGLRADLREALLNDDLEMIKELAASELSEQPASTIVLLATTLQLLGQRSDALRVLREGTSRMPREYGPMAALLDILHLWGWGADWSRDESIEAARLMRAMLVVRPRSLWLRNNLFWQLMHQAVEPELSGGLEAADALYRQAANEIEALIYHKANKPYSEVEVITGVDADYYSVLGFALTKAGERERAIVAFRQFAEMLDLDLFQQKSEFAMVFYASRASSPLVRAGELEAAERLHGFMLETHPRSVYTFHALWFVRALIRARDGSADDVEATLREAVARAPGSAEGTSNDLAWRVARWPRSVLRSACTPRDPADLERVERNLDALLDEALRMSEFSTSRTGTSNSWNTLGTARYRAGDLEGCIRALETAIGTRDSAFDRYVLAMAHHDLGDEEEARRQYQRAHELMDVRWPGDRNEVEELVWFRDEAAELLGPQEAR